MQEFNFLKIINIVEDICTSIGILIKQLKLSTRVICIIVGVGLVDFAGQYNNHVVVTGDGIDAVELTKLQRKKVGSSELVSVGLVEYGGNDFGNVQIPVEGYYSYQNPNGYGPGYGYEHQYAYGPGYGYETN